MDGVVVEGHSAVDEASITGESIPKEKSPGARVFAGTINGPGVLKVQAASSAEETLLARLIQLVQEAQQEKPRTQLFIERFERRYARFVVAASLLVGTLPPLVLGWSWSETVYRAMIFLVVASPCALVASMMPTVLSGISNGARHGILFKGGSHLEIMGELDVVAFDKTGTLTHGRPVVTDVVALDGGAGARQRVLQIAGSLERWSEHPLAAAVVAAAEAERVPLLEPEELQETPGAGLAGKVAGAPCLVGSVDFAARSGIELPGQLRQAVEELEHEGKALAVVACAGRALGVLAFQDTLREQAPRVIRRLKEMGVRKVIMLTGDTQRSGEAIGAKAGCDQVYASLLPEDKVRIVKELSASHRRVAMVGDGVNDAPALASASVGIAMGGAGSDVALETADVVLVSDDLEKLPYAIALARRVRRIVKQNIVFSLSVIALLVTANFMEAISLPVGVIGHEGSTVLVILNGLRALCTPPRRRGKSPFGAGGLNAPGLGAGARKDQSRAGPPSWRLRRPATMRLSTSSSVASAMERVPTISPWRRTEMRSPTSKISCMRWLMMMIETPWPRRSRTSSSRRWEALGERLAVGSSMMSTLGSNARARAMATACCRPPESVSTGVRSEGKANFIRSITFAASCSILRRSTSSRAAGHRPKKTLDATSRLPQRAKFW